MADRNVAHPQSFSSLRESVWTIRKHIFGSRLPSLTSAPTFVAEFYVCTLLHCAVTLPLTLITFNWPQSVYTAGHMQYMLFVDSLYVSEESCAKVPFRYDTIHRTL